MVRIQQGFTLLEVMVVLVIIGGLLSLVGLNSGDRRARDLTEEFATQLVVQMNLYREEAVYTNQDLGLAMDRAEMLLLRFQDVNRQEVQAGLDREALDRLIKNPWQTYESPSIGLGSPAVPEGLRMTLVVNEEEVDFESLLDEETGPLPALMFLSSEEFTAFELTLENLDDPSFEVKVHGDGFNPIWRETLSYEE